MSNSSVTGGLLARASSQFEKVEDFANLLASFAIFLLMVLGVAQIVMRTFFNSPINGYIDLVELSMASMAFLGASYCQRLGAHIRMELFVGRVSGRPYWATEIFGTLVAMTIIGVLIWYSTGHFWRSYTLGDSTIDAEFAVWPSKLLVPIAFSIWFIRLSFQLWGSVRLFIDPAGERIAVVTIKEVAEQAQDEITDIMGDDAVGTDGDKS